MIGVVHHYFPASSETDWGRVASSIKTNKIRRWGRVGHAVQLMKGSQNGPFAVVFCDLWKLFQVVAVDIKNKTAMFKDGFKMEYNKVLLATGNM